MSNAIKKTEKIRHSCILHDLLRKTTAHTDHKNILNIHELLRKPLQ